MRSFLLLLVAGWLLGLAFGILHVSLVILLVCALVVTAIVRWSRQPLPIAAAAGCLLLLGATYSSGAKVPVVTCTITPPVRGTITAPPHFSPTDARYIVTTTTGCVVQATTSRFPKYAQQDEVELSGGTRQNVQEIGIQNKGYARYLQNKGVQIVWRFAQILPITINQQDFSTYTTLDASITRLFKGGDAGVIRALILADDGEVPEKLKKDFRVTGLTHLLAISGMNISLLAGMLLILVHLLPIHSLSKTILISSLLWVYIVIIGWPVSAARATFFWTIALLALRLRVLVSLPSVLITTLVLMLSLQPHLLEDIGFQLSVAAVGGIFLQLFLTKRTYVGAPKVIKVVVAAAAVTLGATVTTWPIILFHFGTISLLSLPANLLVAPIVGIQMLFALTTLLVGSLSPAAALVPSYFTHLTIVWMEYVASFFASVQWGYIENRTITPPWIATYYIAVVLVSFAWLKFQKRSWREIWQ